MVDCPGSVLAPDHRLPESQSKIHIFVVDDICRFAIHLFRYLSANCGFGIGQIHKDDHLMKRFGSADEPKPLISENGLIALWWLPAKGKLWLRSLEEIKKKMELEKKTIISLIDILGERVKKDENDQYEEYDFIDAKDALKSLSKDETFVVSSYSTRVAGAIERVWPKSPETLWMICDHVRKALMGRSRKDPITTSVTETSLSGIFHILITGHGFEIQADPLSFGLPQTVDLLHEMGSPFTERGEMAVDKTDRNLFPIPTAGIWQRGAYRSIIGEIARNKELDAYWDFLLETQLYWEVGENPKPARIPKKIKANRLEHRIRDAFRRVILKYDWGNLYQYYYALRLPWKCWLTTNYTRFADRALEMIQNQKETSGTKRLSFDGPLGWRETTSNDGGPKSLPDWSIIGTAKDAAMLIKEELHDPGIDKLKRYHLFKLHGDIGQLHTMAIAGHDKEMYSLLSHPVDNLHDLYAAAESHLLRRLNPIKGEKQETKVVVWHIVGHGLKDHLLRDLIRKVIQPYKELRSVFLVANPNPNEPSQEVDKILEVLPEANSKPEAYQIPLKAVEYLSRLYFVGLPDKTESIGQWLKDARILPE